MTIDLPPEAEQALDEAAREQGTTPEALVEALVHDLLLSRSAAKPAPHPANSLADELAEFIGAIDSGEYISGGARLSERTGAHYGALLMRRHRDNTP